MARNRRGATSSCSTQPPRWWPRERSPPWAKPCPWPPMRSIQAQLAKNWKGWSSSPTAANDQPFVQPSWLAFFTRKGKRAAKGRQSRALLLLKATSLRSRILPLALLSNYFVSLYWLSLKILIEPIDDVLQSLDAMPGLARAREFVRFLGEAHHHHRLLEKFQGPKHSLAARRRRSA